MNLTQTGSYLPLGGSRNDSVTPNTPAKAFASPSRVCESKCRNGLTSKDAKGSRAVRVTAARGDTGGSNQPPAEPPCDTGPLQLTLAASPHNDGNAPAPFRFWIDEVLWSAGHVAVALPERVLSEGGGRRTGGPSREQHRLAGGGGSYLDGGACGGGGALGSQHMDRWEVLWTKSTYVIPAARTMRPGQLVSAIIGLNCLTMKKRLLLTLRAAHGSAGAARLLPLSFALPEELGQWEAAVREQEQARGAGGGVPELWMVKTGQDAGKGLTLLPGREALRYARQQLAVEAARGTRRYMQLQVAQRYVSNPLLLLGRKFHLRLWVLVATNSPLRAYLHRRGLVLFSSEPYNSNDLPYNAVADDVLKPRDSSSSSSQSSPGPAHEYDSFQAHDPPRPPTHGSVLRVPVSAITNYAQNANSMVWSMDTLREHLGHVPFDTLWGRLCAACGQAVAAARGPVREATAWLAAAVQEYGFQVMGVDFLLDEHLHPWLLEFNSSPSMMVQHQDGEVRQLIYEQKYGMLRDTWEMVRPRVFQGGGDVNRGSRVRGRRAEAGKGSHVALGEYVSLEQHMD